MPILQSKSIYHGLPVFPQETKGFTAIVTGANGISGDHMVRWPFSLYFLLSSPYGSLYSKYPSCSSFCNMGSLFHSFGFFANRPIDGPRYTHYLAVPRTEPGQPMWSTCLWTYFSLQTFWPSKCEKEASVLNTSSSSPISSQNQKMAEIFGVRPRILLQSTVSI